MSEQTIFDQIIAGEMDADVVYEDERSMAFRDIDPQAPVHDLVIPKEKIASVNDVTVEDEELVGHLVRVAHEVAEIEGIDDSGYRLVVNCGDHGGQEVEHLHIHVLGGRSMEWPPG
jgi:histidine triad (HIT) family protein